MKPYCRTLGTLTLSTLTSAILILGSAAHAAQPTSPAHAHEQSATAHEHDVDMHALKLNEGKKWQTDAPLRQGMSTIKAALDAQRPALHEGTMSDANYEALAGEVDAQVAYMVQNCNLDPEPDAVLHVLLAQAIEGSDALKGAAESSRSAGLEKVAEALQHYGDYFEHPGWEAPAPITVH